jgi:hypothetical protein
LALIKAIRFASILACFWRTTFDALANEAFAAFNLA